MALAVAASSGRLKAMMPPKAEVGIGAEGAVVGLQRRGGHRHAAGVRVLDDDAGRLRELPHALQRGVGVGDVVVRQFLALQLPRRRDARRRRRRVGVERRRLVRVLAVAQVVLLVELQRQGRRDRPRSVPASAAQVAGHHRVVGSGVGVGPGREPLARREGQLSRGADLLQRTGVVGRVHQHGHVRVVLRRRAQHGGPADVDVLHGVVVAAAGPRDGRCKGIEVDDQQVDRLDAVLAHHGIVRAAPAEQAAVHPGMQRLDAPVHDLREPGVAGYVAHRQACLAQQLRRAAGGQQLDARPVERAGEFRHAGLVGHADQRPPYPAHVMSSRECRGRARRPAGGFSLTVRTRGASCAASRD